MPITTHVALRFRVTHASEDLLQGFMLTRVTVEGVEEDGGETLYYIPVSVWNSEFEVEVKDFVAASSGITFLGSEQLENRDWNAEWEQSIEPQQATEQLVITPSWRMEEAVALDAKYLITIDPKMSFGTGHHETTRLCLHALEQIDCTQKSVLDIGTGSGVLAIYALLRGAQHAIAIDTDSWSIENAEENRALNNFKEAQLEIRKGMLDETVRNDEQFDIILANIHRNVLIEIAAAIHSQCRPDAKVVLSGLLMYDVDEVRAAYEAAGFAFVREERENEWASLSFEAAV